MFHSNKNLELALRELKEDDLEAVLELYDQPEMDDGAALDIDKATMIFARTKLYPFYRFFLAESVAESVAEPIAESEAKSGKEILGVYALLIMDNIGHSGSPSGIVEGVCVSPKHQGGGVGKAMMQHAMNICREHGCYKLALSSNIRRIGAHDFYKGLGFSQHGLSFLVEL